MPTNALAARGRKEHLNPRISTPSAGRKPPHFTHSPRPWKRSPPTPAGDHYLRPIVADIVKEQTAVARVHAILQSHLQAAKGALPAGRRGAPSLGRATSCRILDAFKTALESRRPPVIAGGAVAFCAALGVNVGVDAASAALRLVAAVTPLLQRGGRFLWSVDLAAAKRSSPDDRLIVEILSRRPGQAVTPTTSETPRESEPVRTRSKEHAHAVVAHDLNTSPDAGPAPDPAASGLGCASPAPAEADRSSPATSPARASDAPVALTLSGWYQAVPSGIHCQRLLSLLADRRREVLSGSAREIVDQLAAQDGRWTSRRDRWGLLRAALTFERRGLLVRTGNDLRAPEMVKHDVVDMLDLRERPSTTAPTMAQRRVLERKGIDPTGLSRGEARVVTYVLRKRADSGVMSYKQVKAIGAVMGQTPADVSRTVVHGRSVDFEMFMGLVRSVPCDHGASHG